MATYLVFLKITLDLQDRNIPAVSANYAPIHLALPLSFLPLPERRSQEKQGKEGPTQFFHYLSIGVLYATLKQRGIGYGQMKSWQVKM